MQHHLPVVLDAAPLSSSIRAHSRRTARSLAIVSNCSSLAASRNSTSAAGVVDRDPRGVERTQVVGAEREDVAELLDVGAAEVVHRGAVDDQRPAAELARDRRSLRDASSVG